MHQVQAEVIENEKFGPYMLMKLKAPGLARDAQPGQFVMLQVSPSGDPLLRRPFGIHGLWFEKQSVEKPGRSQGR